MYYSQFGEDKFLIDNFLSRPGIPKFYIELGAIDGIRYSNTKTLEDEHGWSGILIEPIPSAFEKLKLNRPGNMLVNSIVGSEEGEVKFRFFNNPDLQCVSAVKSTQKESHEKQWMNLQTAENDWLADQIENDLQEIILPTQSLGGIVRRSRIPSFGLLSLDVEGHELEVLKSYDWEIPVSYILVEGSRENDADVFDYITEKGGVFECHFHINMLFSFLG
ncbi:FkbM family methyltransferase [Cyanobium sp. ATX 6F1]|uniref:FkbM family methyltransferase n=1 Tax=unclassified Cyanobium TaxID=2627006 RepID=UPI0020CD1CAF|nr:FkbM family methyltransferase [Cyanobium sp. ATX 6F1]MCP9917499.1 FkbM family methyltransferase [Cyanobium sp. ATX 6F1]